MDNVNVRMIRSKLGLSQEQFSKVYQLPLGTVRNWEQGRRSPDKTAVILLKLIDKIPEKVKEALAS